MVLYAADSALADSRIGFVVGRRVGKAVVRNRVKRRVREAVRARYDRLVRSVDLVWTARPASAEAAFGELDSAVEQLLRAARLVRDRTLEAGHPSAPPARGAPSSTDGRRGRRDDD